MYDSASATQRAYADYEAGVLPDNTTGIVIHRVIEQVDRSALISARDVKIQPGWGLNQFEEYMHSIEHELIVDTTTIKVEEILAKRQASS
jgi:folate-dependent phosphoribosylglycinamide formyltransferase PurN